MPVDDSFGAEPRVPVGRAFGATPLGEFRVFQNACWFARQREVADQKRCGARRKFFQALLGHLNTRVAPGVDTWIRVVVKNSLVRAHHACLVCQREAFRLGGRAVRSERVVVEHEQWHDGKRSVSPLPHGIRVLRCEHANPAAHRHQVSVSGFTAQLNWVRAERPQFMVAGHPDHGGETGPEGAQGPLDVRGFLRHVPCDQQPVARGAWPEVRHEFPVLGVADMQIADGEQSPRRVRVQPASSWPAPVSSWPALPASWPDASADLSPVPCSPVAATSLRLPDCWGQERPAQRNSRPCLLTSWRGRSEGLRSPGRHSYGGRPERGATPARRGKREGPGRIRAGGLDWRGVRGHARKAGLGRRPAASAQLPRRQRAPVWGGGLHLAGRLPRDRMAGRVLPDRRSSTGPEWVDGAGAGNEPVDRSRQSSAVCRHPTPSWSRPETAARRCR